MCSLGRIFFLKAALGAKRFGVLFSQKPEQPEGDAVLLALVLSFRYIQPPNWHLKTQFRRTSRRAEIRIEVRWGEIHFLFQKQTLKKKKGTRDQRCFERD